MSSEAELIEQQELKVSQDIVKSEKVDDSEPKEDTVQVIESEDKNEEAMIDAENSADEEFKSCVDSDLIVMETNINEKSSDAASTSTVEFGKSKDDKRATCKCCKCDQMNNIVLLFYNINCQHVLCVKCLSLLGHVSQLKCECLMKNHVKCEALWTRKSCKILAYIDPLFMDGVSLKLEKASSLNVDKSDTSVEVILDMQALKFLRHIKPCIPGLPTLEPEEKNEDSNKNKDTKNRESRNATSMDNTSEIVALDSPPRKRSRRTEGKEKEEQSKAGVDSVDDTATSRKSSSRRATSRDSTTKSDQPKSAKKVERVSRETKSEVSDDAKENTITATHNNPLLNRPLGNVENTRKLNAANDPATYKKVMKKNFKGETKLHEACQKGMLEKAKEWLEMGSDPNTTDNAKLRPIHEHGVINNAELCKLLLEYGAEVNVAGGAEDLMPLHIAISNNCFDTARLLIQYGADINAKGVDPSGEEFTAMSLAEKMASKFGCTELLTVVQETKREVFEVVAPKPLCAPPKSGKPINFSVSGLSEEEKDIAIKFADKFPDQVRYNPNYNNDCEALVCGKSKIKNYPPSIKVVAAILTNGNIIDASWMKECLSNRTFLDYEGYLIDSVCGIKGGVAKARESNKNNPKKLFYGLKFYVSPKLQTFNFNQICMLIEIGDGHILASAPEPAAGKKLLESNKNVPEFLKDDSMIHDLRLGYVTEDIFGHIQKLGDGAYKMSPDWILNCVASYSLPSNVFPQCSSTDVTNSSAVAAPW